MSAIPPPLRPPELGRIARLADWLTRRLASTLEWVGRHETSVLVALLVVVLCLWGFAHLAGEVFEGDTQAFDEWTLRALRQQGDPSVPWGPRWLHEVGRDLTALGGIAALSLMIAAVAGFLWIRRLYFELAVILLATTSGLVASTLLKQLFVRERPGVVPHLSLALSHSFPSGHSLLAAVVYLTLGTLLARITPQPSLKAYFLGVALLLTVLVGVSRVYLGVHYPTDVLAGWTVGLAWGLCCWLLSRRLRPQS